MIDNTSLFLLSTAAIGGITIYVLQNHKGGKKALPKPHKINYSEPPSVHMHKTKFEKKQDLKRAAQKHFKPLIKSSHFV